MKETMEQGRTRPAEAGFTLVEALIAMVVLIFGLMAITNLFVIAGSSNMAANQGTAATNIATQKMEQLLSAKFSQLADGGNVDSDNGSCPSTNPVAGCYYQDDVVTGVGVIHTRWKLDKLDNQTFFLRVRSEAKGVLNVRTRTELTGFRVCTQQSDPINCPAP